MLLHESRKRNNASDIRLTSPWHRHQTGKGLCPYQRPNTIQNKASYESRSTDNATKRTRTDNHTIGLRESQSARSPKPFAYNTNLNFLDLEFRSKIAGGMCKKCTNRRFLAHFYTWFDLGFYDFSTSFLTSSKPICV